MPKAFSSSLFPTVANEYSATLFSKKFDFESIEIMSIQGYGFFVPYNTGALILCNRWSPTYFTYCFIV